MKRGVHIVENDPVVVGTEDGGKPVSIRVFTLSLNAVTVQLSSLGASILQILIPSRFGGSDDVVLGLKSVKHMWDTKNPPYFSTVVGRVANRINKGRLQIENGPDAEVFQLELNNGRNHLHGGFVGFNRRNWEASILDDKSVQFTFVSQDGDQLYPGSVEVRATYSLLMPTSSPSSSRFGARLLLKLEAFLLGEKATPVNLAQHSYFNLHRHDSPSGCLDHELMLNCDAYTPVDDTMIPTREVRKLSDDPVMDWRHVRLMKEALIDYGVAKAGKSFEEAKQAAESTRIAPHTGTCGPSSSAPGEPYGFDHNYVVIAKSKDDNDDDDHEDYDPDSLLPLVAVLVHEASGRRLRVRSDAPGVQLYTANFLDGVSLSCEDCKESAVYAQWQSICLETQHFPDSILVDETIHKEFAKGRCIVLRPDQPHYEHNVEYDFEYDAVPSSDDEGAPCVTSGSDSNGGYFASVDEMWEAQGVFSSNNTKESCSSVSAAGRRSSSSSSWYQRAAEYYEENCDASVEGVLGGFSSLSDLDLKGSRAFVQSLEQLQTPSGATKFQWSSGAACECGAGIGRVSKGLLLPLGVSRCDLVEASSRLISQAPEYIGDEESNRCRFYCSGLQEWEPSLPRIYSIVWIQWVLCYLTDDDAVAFLERCAASLVDGGYIVLKENACLLDEEGFFVLDAQDASVTRSVPYWRQLIRRAGLQVVYQRYERDFPRDIFPVPMLALQPILKE